MQAEIEILQVEKKIRSRVKKQMEKTQKEYYLNEQMQAIQKELGERDEFKNEIQELEEKLKTKKLSARKRTAKVKKELKKLKMMHADERGSDGRAQLHRLGAGAALVRQDRGASYDIDEAEKILDEDHYGLKKVKERILEYLAVQALVKKLKGPILCFVGPPGVGKTSLAQVDRARDGPQVRAPVARRRARRGRDPRPPPHVHRRAARQDHPVAEEGRHATTRSSCSTRSTRCRPTSAAIPRRRCSRCSTPSRTTPSTITTSTSTTTCRDVMFITTANTLHGHPDAAAGPHGDHPAPRLHRVREAQHRGEVPGAAPAEGDAASRTSTSTITENAIRTVIHHYTQGSRRP